MATPQVTAKPRKPRERKPSAFSPQVKITLSVHAQANATVSNDDVAKGIADAFAETGNAVRVVHRTREGAGADAIPSYMVYVAPAGFEFPSATAKAGGVRLDKDTADLLRQIAASMGLDPAKPESIMAVAKALAAKATPAS